MQGDPVGADAMHLRPDERDMIAKLYDQIARLERMIVKRDVQIADRDEQIAVLEDALAGVLEEIRR